MRRKLIIWVCLVTLLAGVFAAPAAAKKKIKLNTKKVVISVGEKYELQVTGTSKKVKWSSSKKKVAKVNKKGVVTGKKTGKAKITAKVGKKKLTCKVTVTVKIIPGATAAPNSTGKTNTNSGSSNSSGSDSLMDSKTEPSTTSGDDGWVPGWY